MIMGWMLCRQVRVIWRTARKRRGALDQEGGRRNATTFIRMDSPIGTWGFWGSAYDKPTNSALQYAWLVTSGKSTALDGNLDTRRVVINYFTQVTPNKFTMTSPVVNTQTVTIATPPGIVTSAFYHPAVMKKRSGMGVVLQDENIVRGAFRGTDASGSFQLESN